MLLMNRLIKLLMPVKIYVLKNANIVIKIYVIKKIPVLIYLQNVENGNHSQVDLEIYIQVIILALIWFIEQ